MRTINVDLWAAYFFGGVIRPVLFGLLVYPLYVSFCMRAGGSGEGKGEERGGNPGNQITLAGSDCFFSGIFAIEFLVRKIL